MDAALYIGVTGSRLVQVTFILFPLLAIIVQATTG